MQRRSRNRIYDARRSLSPLAVLWRATSEKLRFGTSPPARRTTRPRATDIARAMSPLGALGDALGVGGQSTRWEQASRGLYIPMAQGGLLHGEETAQTIDADIKRILTAQRPAAQILTANREKIEGS